MLRERAPLMPLRYRAFAGSGPEGEPGENIPANTRRSPRVPHRSGNGLFLSVIRGCCCCRQMKKTTADIQSMRLDKWLWAARFFKTRALATAAIGGGKVHVCGDRVKPSRRIARGENLTVQKGPYRFSITVTGLAAQRRPADEARKLYTESDDSVMARRSRQNERSLQGHGAGLHERRPDKRTRRLIHRFKQQQ
jgi:ribosome-associated heat shock protein Hsp15